MKYSWFFALGLIACLGMNSGCSSSQKVVAMEGDFNQPYESLGVLEVDREVPRIQYRRVFGQLWEWITIGHAENISREDYLRGLLDKKILKAAKKNHQAEAVIFMQYWPDLTSQKFPQGRIHAKGEMVRHKRFPL